MFQPAPDLARLDPDYRIFTGCVSGRPQEDFRPDGSFFQLLRLAVEPMFNHVAQKLLATARMQEKRAGEDVLELVQYLVPVRFLAVRPAMGKFMPLRLFKERLHGVLTGIPEG
ncbi:MAG TPA: hypothetical protein VGF96_10775 [Terracidiphilus sp.]